MKFREREEKRRRNKREAQKEKGRAWRRVPSLESHPPTFLRLCQSI
jgi:hypothetical protein